MSKQFKPGDRVVYRETLIGTLKYVLNPAPSSWVDGEKVAPIEAVVDFGAGVRPRPLPLKYLQPLGEGYESQLPDEPPC